MDRIKDFESRNARTWEEDDDDSVVSDREPPQPSSFSAPTSLANKSAVHSTAARDAKASSSAAANDQHLVDLRPAIDPHRTPGQLYRTPGPPVNTVNIARRPDTHASVRRDESKYARNAQAQSRPGAGYSSRGSPSQSSPAKTKNPFWAKNAQLVTSRKADMKQRQAVELAEQSKYLKRPAQDAIFQYMGVYLWDSDEDVFDILGGSLSRLNVFRETHKVYIEWVEATRLLKISANTEEAIMTAIKNINQTVESARVRAKTERPLFIVEAPSGCIQSSIVIPRLEPQDQPEMHPTLCGFAFIEGKHSAREELEWAGLRSEMAQMNKQNFQDHLQKSLKSLSFYKGWLRMRVHFGLLRLQEYQTTFLDRKDGKFVGRTFEQFAKMMAHNRVKGTFNKEINDAAIGMRLINNLKEYPDRFGPLDDAITTLAEVRPKHTIIAFIQTPTDNLRLEAQLDERVGELQQADDGSERWTVEYQFGTTKLFKLDNRKPRMQVAFVDLEKRLDWDLEIVSDDAEIDIPSSILAFRDTFIDNTFTAETKHRVDNLHQRYPTIRPRNPNGFAVPQVVIRSISSYKTNPGGYSVDVAVYREWEGCNTMSEPRIMSSVSLSHPSWDYEMQSNEATTRVRDWREDMSNFFDPATGGFDGFVADIRLLHSLLHTSSKDYSILD